MLGVDKESLNLMFFRIELSTILHQVKILVYAISPYSHSAIEAKLDRE